MTGIQVPSASHSSRPVWYRRVSRAASFKAGLEIEIVAAPQARDEKLDTACLTPAKEAACLKPLSEGENAGPQ